LGRVGDRKPGAPREIRKGCAILFVGALAVGSGFLALGLVNDVDAPGPVALVPASFAGLCLCILGMLIMPTVVSKPVVRWLALVCFTIPWVVAAVLICARGVKNGRGEAVPLLQTIVMGAAFCGVALLLVVGTIRTTVGLFHRDEEE
jgi:hypothetical protein